MIIPFVVTDAPRLVSVALCGADKGKHRVTLSAEWIANGEIEMDPQEMLELERVIEARIFVRAADSRQSKDIEI